MDSGRKSDRMFPAFTTKELKARAAALRETGKGSDDAMLLIALEDEIERRDSGVSLPFVVPQL